MSSKRFSIFFVVEKVFWVTWPKIFCGFFCLGAIARHVKKTGFMTFILFMDGHYLNNWGN